MGKCYGFPFLTLALLASLPAHAQSSPSHTPSPKDYSTEAAVVEEMTTKVTFENSGNYTREQTSRVRVQTDAGIKEWGVLAFPYQSATQTVEIDYVRVRKPDGTTIVTPQDNVQDLDSEITRSAPFYSDLREKHVAVKGLGSGDILEYQAHWHTTKALIPGQFWFQYSFHHEGIVLHEHLEVKVPADRAVKFKGPQAAQTITVDSGFRTYSWTYSRLDNNKEAGSDRKKEIEAALGRRPPPDVQISSFQTWEEVGHWYWNLQKDRVEPTPAVRAKAAELTKGMTDDADKLQALYTFVSTHYRYIGIAFGIGRYQPHAADDVLDNNYGDCKDKQTLLASLLQASGISLYPALIDSTSKLDSEIPSPAQFDHVIGYLPRGTNAVWLDTTPEVAPVGFLLQLLRDKPALVIAGEKSVQLITTPADPPLSGIQTFKIEGKLSEDGTFDAKVEDTLRGEPEIFIRAAFRRVPQPLWKDLVQQVSYGLGFAGTVSDVSASSPELINEPFHFSYSYNRKDYPDWSDNRRFTVPGLPFGMPPVRDDSKDPVWLGSPMESVTDSRVQVPKGYQPQLPSNVDLKYDFAEYHASYSLDDDVVIAKRRLLTKMREVPVAKLQDYRDFIKNVQNDVNRYVQTSSASSPAHPPVLLNPPGPPGFLFVLKGINTLPDSDSSEASKLEADARERMAGRDMPGAVASLRRAVEVDPKFTRAWVFLGTFLLAQRQTDAGIEAFHKAMASDPNVPAIPKALGFGLMGARNFQEAVPVWQDFIKAHPEDVDGPANLGDCFLRLNRYSEAAAAFEAAIKIKPDFLSLRMHLGAAYLGAGDRDKAVAAFTQLAAADKDKKYLNDVAYKMANADLQLPAALDYAQQAVRSVGESSQKITLQDLKMEDLGNIFAVAAYWDTLGWVNERMSNMETAERYLQASWKMTQDGVVAGHLCHLYRRTHQTAAAIRMCRAALYRIPLSGGLALDESPTEMAAAQENLDFLTHGASKSKTTVDASDLVIRERTFKLPRFVPGTESAEFFLLFASDGKSRTFKVEDTKFISGSDKMKLQGKQLKTIDFQIPAPSDVPTRFVRRGILGCYQYTGCSFVLLDPPSVQSVN